MIYVHYKYCGMRFKNKNNENTHGMVSLSCDTPCFKKQDWGTGIQIAHFMRKMTKRNPTCIGRASINCSEVSRSTEDACPKFEGTSILSENPHPGLIL